MFFGKEYFDDLRRIAIQYCLLNYDFCYLQTMHEKNRLEGTKTIIAGSSHAMNGIVEEMFDERPINFSISSQDVFYDFQNIRKAVLEGAQRIENCIVNLGYYMLYQDVSLSKNIGKKMIPRVYAPLFGDTHNYPDAADYDMLELLDYDKSKYSDELLRLFCAEWAGRGMLEEATYYGTLRSRERNNQLYLRGIEWKSLSDGEREQIAIERTKDHNNIKKHLDSRRENAVILQDMVCFLAERDIRTIFVIFPFTKYYNQYIDPEYKTDIYDALNELEQPVEFLDMNELDGFDDNDFLDADHMNYEGAVKASSLLNAFLNLEEERDE